MKKSLLSMLVIAPLAVGLTGCVVAVGTDGDGHYVSSSDFGDREYKNRKKIAKLALGASYRDVASDMGVADFTESYEKEGKTIQVLFYRTNRIHKDDLTTRDECTYLYFIDGELKETGRGGDFSRNITL